MGNDDAVIEASMKIKSLDDLTPDKSARIVFGSIIATIIGSNFISKWFDFGKYVLPKGNRFATWELLFVVAGFLIDDTCTAVGMQAEEMPRSMVEGNVHMGGVMQWWIKQGWAKTETAAHRCTLLVFMAIIFGFHYMGWLTANSRVLLMVTAMQKAYAGYDWCNLKPNNYTHADLWTFKDGRPTPERMSIPLQMKWNIAHGYTYKKPERRRLAEIESTEGPKGAIWIQRFLYNIFPMV